MKGIIVRDENSERINVEVARAQKGCRERLIDYRVIKYMLKAVEVTLDIPKCRMKGVEVDCDPHAQHFANAYHGTPESTQFYAVHTGCAWKLMSVDRGPCRSVGRKRIVRLTDDAKAAVIERFEAF